MYGKSVILSCQVVSYSKRFNHKSTKNLLKFLAEMPKVNTARITDAQRQRQNITKKSEKYGSSTVYLQVLGSGARGVPNTLYMFTDQKRYLFNCGECTQRLAHEHKVKLSKLDHIFITSKTWRNIGGLPGLSLTLQDVGVPNITLHGPDGLDELYNATQRFVIMKEMNVTMANCKIDEEFDDNVMNVKYVFLESDDMLDNEQKPAVKRPKLDNSDTKAFEQFIHDKTDYYRADVRNMEARKNVDRNTQDIKSPNKNKVKKVLNALESSSNGTVAYICTLKKRLGTLDLAKCVEMGVKPGPMLGLLKSGQDVVLPNGKMVFSKDVKTPDDPGPVFIVLEVPDISYLQQRKFELHFDNEINPPENIPTLIVHYTPKHVMNHPTYREFLAKFGPSTQHLVLNENNSCLGSEAVHRTQHKLNLLDSEIFPLLRDISVPIVWGQQPIAPRSGSPEKLKCLEELKNKFQSIINVEEANGDYETPNTDDILKTISGRSLTIFHLRPKKELDRSAEPKLHIQEYIQETLNVDGFAESLGKFRELVHNIRHSNSGSQKEYPKVIFLGTGSCIPSKTRNTSGIVFQISENRSMLLDCGEGTYGQLVRFFGHKKVDSFLRTLKAIYISHLHADHHIGLIGVLQARRQAFNAYLGPSAEVEPVYLLAPGQIVTWISLYDKQFENIRDDLTLIPNQNLLMEQLSSDMTPAILANIGASNIRTCLVSHCPNAFGVCIDASQYRLTYSGDTIPCDDLAKLGNGSTLLIHEATMEDELADEARIKMHSTTSQAIEIGRKMNAKYTVLTHFSQRYARLPRLNANILHDNRTVGIAFDNMQITRDDLKLLPHMYAPLQLMFAEHCVEMELKAASRARIKERRSSPLTLPTSVKGSPKRAGAKKVIPRVSSTKPCNYTETNASRLRQETKGMPVFGLIRPSMTRPSSPDFSYSRSYSSRTPSQCMSPIVRRVESTPKYLAKSSSQKTFSCVSQCLTNDLDMKFDSKKKTAPVKSTSSLSGSPISTANGKPTSINKKYTMRKDSIRTPSQCMSPIVRRVESTPKYLAKSSSQKTFSCVSQCLTNDLDRKFDSKKKTAPVKSTSSLRGSPISTANGKPTSTNKKYTMGKDSITKNNDGKKSLENLILRSMPPINSYRDRQRGVPLGSSKANGVAAALKQEVNPARPFGETRCSSRESLQGSFSKLPKNNFCKPFSLNVNPHWLPSHDSLGGSCSKLDKREFYKPFSSNGKPHYSIYSSKSYKPQLEDIKSSNLLLMKPSAETVHEPKRKEKEKLKSRPQKLNEAERQRQLALSKQKFQSKQYVYDSKYDKIEGLNWFTWK